MIWISMALAMAQPGVAAEALTEMPATFVAAADAWHACTKKEAARLAGRSREPSETIATAAFGACADLEGKAEDELRVYIIADLGTEEGADAAVLRATEKGRARWREKLITMIVEARTQ